MECECTGCLSIKNLGQTIKNWDFSKKKIRFALIPLVVKHGWLGNPRTKWQLKWEKASNQTWDFSSKPRLIIGE